jgi:hypothetical protein
MHCGTASKRRAESKRAMAGIIWFDVENSVTWVATNWLYESFLLAARHHLPGDQAASELLQTATKQHDLKLGAIGLLDPDLAHRLRAGLRAEALAALQRGTDFEGRTKKYQDETGQEVFLDKMREYLDRDRQPVVPQ